jgi:hypothetical protein
LNSLRDLRGLCGEKSGFDDGGKDLDRVLRLTLQARL